ncbi:MAG: MMPL family transporter [bacterium]
MSKTRYIPVALWLVLLAAASWSGWLTTPVSGDLALFMPQPRSMVERLFLTEIGQGPAARIVLIAVEGGTPAQRAGTSRRLARLLRKHSGISRVENGSFTRATRTPEPFFGHRYLLSPSATRSRFTPGALREALTQRLEELTAPISPFPRKWLPRDPTGEFLSYLRAGHPLHSPKRHLGVWFSPDRAQALLMAETRASALEVEANSRVVSAIETAFGEARGDAPLSLRMSGAGVFAVRSRDTIRDEVRLLSVLASVAVVAILLWFFRSPLLLVLGGLPLASGIVVGWGAVGLFYDGIHGITLAFGVILLGVTIDYPIHLFTHLRPGARPETVVRQVWPSLRLSWITTALGFGVMITTPFNGLAQVGLLAAAGIATAGLVTGWVLPLLIPAGWEPRFGHDRFSWIARIHPTGRAVRVWITVAAVVVVTVLVAGTAWLRPVRWENDLAALSPIPRGLLREDREMRARIGAPEVNHIAFITAKDAQGALEKSEDLAAGLRGLVAGKQLTGFDMAALYLPSHRTQRLRQSRLPPPETVNRSLEQALAGLPFRPGLFAPFRADFAAAHSLTPIGPADTAGTALGLRIGSLLFQGHSGWIALVPLSGVSDGETLAAWFAGRGQDDLFYLHLPSATRGLMTRFREEALERVGLGILIMIAVLLLELRNLSRIARVLLPVAAATLVELSFWIWFGGPLTLFHLFSLLLIFGIGIDYCIFLSQAKTGDDTRVRTAHGLLVCYISTVLMFGALAFSQIPVLNIIGSMVSIGVTLSFLFAMIFAQP